MSGKAEPTAALQRKRSLSATANTYSRLGQVSTITDGSGLRTFNYNLSASWRLDNEALPAFYGSRLLTRLYVPTAVMPKRGKKTRSGRPRKTPRSLSPCAAHTARSRATSTASNLTA